jgi:hypothetical protein
MWKTTELSPLLVYLSPVADDCGPFEYLAVDDTMRMRAETGYKTGYRTDGWLKQAAPWAEPKRCTGNAGSAVLFDGASVLHRAGRPERAERLSLTFTYLTRRPLQIFREARLSRSPSGDLRVPQRS